MWKVRGGACSGRALPKCLGYIWTMERGHPQDGGNGEKRGVSCKGEGPEWIVHTENSYSSTSYFIVSISFVHEDQRELDIGWGFLFDFAWCGIGPFCILQVIRPAGCWGGLFRVMFLFLRCFILCFPGHKLAAFPFCFLPLFYREKFPSYVVLSRTQIR